MVILLITSHLLNVGVSYHLVSPTTPTPDVSGRSLLEDHYKGFGRLAIAALRHTSMPLALRFRFWPNAGVGPFLTGGFFFALVGRSSPG